MSASTPASRLFQERSGKLTSAAMEHLDKLQHEYKLSGQDVMCAWEVLVLSKQEWLSAGYPQDEIALQALRRQLEITAARRKKVQQPPPVSTVKTVFNVTTPPPLKKRTNEISPPSTDAKRQLTMDLSSSVQPFVSPAFPTSESVKDDKPVEILPANDWTAKWMEKTDNYLYMNSSLENITELLRSDLAAFGDDALKGKLIKTPASKVLPVSIEGGNSGEAGDTASKEDPQQDEYATNFDKVGAAVQSRNVLVCGRIVCESENGKLNGKSLLLEGVNGIRVKLEMDNFQNRYSLFPGQHVIVEGMATGSSKIRVERIHEGHIQAAPCLPNARDSSIWVASGPYTGGDDLKFEYLDALLAQVCRSPPDVLILLGPFVDANHKSIASGRPRLEFNGQVFDNVGFEDVLCFFLKRIDTALKNTRTKVCLVSCTDDVTHSVVAFPQPSLDIPQDDENFHLNPLFTSLPNPATINIGNIILGVANVDALFDFQDEGTAVHGFAPKDNMSRLASHLLLQHSYYPIVPPAPESCVDVSARSGLRMSPVDILLVPSRLQCFAQDINGVLCVNPGRSATLKTKMSVARIEVRGCRETPTNVAKNRSKVEFFTIG